MQRATFRSNVRYIVGSVVCLTVGLSIAAPADAVTRSARRPKRTVTTTAATTTAATTTAPAATAPSTTLAPPTMTTTTLTPGKNVSFYYDTPLGGPGATARNPPVCTPDGAGCITYSFTGGTREIAGDLIGYQVNVTASTAHNGRDVSTSMFVFSGAVGGCNVGTFTLLDYSESVPLKERPAVGEVIKATVSKWDIVAGSGTKGLTGITGSGTIEAQFVSPTVVRVTFKGNIACPH